MDRQVERPRNRYRITQSFTGELRSKPREDRCGGAGLAEAVSFCEFQASLVYIVVYIVSKENKRKGVASEEGIRGCPGTSICTQGEHTVYKSKPKSSCSITEASFMTHSPCSAPRPSECLGPRGCSPGRNTGSHMVHPLGETGPVSFLLWLSSALGTKSKLTQCPFAQSGSIRAD